MSLLLCPLLLPSSRLRCNISIVNVETLSKENQIKRRVTSPATTYTPRATLVRSFVATYATIDAKVLIVTIPKEYTPATGITLVFYCHKSNETGRTDHEYDFYKEGG